MKVRIYAENVHETTVKRGKTAGQKMGMGKVSDETGDLNFVSFPESWSAGKIKKGKCYNITGDIQGKNNEMQIVVQEVEEIKKETFQPA